MGELCAFEVEVLWHVTNSAVGWLMLFGWVDDAMINTNGGGEEEDDTWMTLGPPKRVSTAARIVAGINLCIPPSTPEHRDNK